MAIILVLVKVKGSHEQVVTHASLDSGSSHSFCSDDLMNRLNIKGEKRRLFLSTMEKKNSPFECRALSGLQVSDLDGNEFLSLPEVYSRQAFPVGKEDIPKPDDLRKWAHLNNVHIPEVDAEVGLLLGNNVPLALEPLQVIRSKENGPFALKTRLGWMIHGPLNVSDKLMARVYSMKLDHQLNKQVERWLKMEEDITTADTSMSLSQNDIKFMENANSSMRLVNGHYSIKLPIKNRDVQMPDNKFQAEHRARLLLKRFMKDEKFYQDYKKFMEDLIKKGYAEKIPLSNDNKKVWYLPHHGVYHPMKPDKIRVVFDCAAKAKGVCLNDNLLQGPDMMNSLVGVLTRFRQEQVAMMADVETMFYQVKVPEEDRDLLRFMWYPGGDTSKEMEEYRMTVYIFGSVCSPSTAMLALRQTAKDHPEVDEEVRATVERNFYVDDLLKSVQSVSEAQKVQEKITLLLKTGGFNLSKWISNSKEVIESIPVNERAKKIQALNLDLDKLPNDRALGVQWRPENDSLGFKTVDKEKPATRQGCLPIVSSVYDPLGFAGPFIVPTKLILQDLSKLQLHWDQECRKLIKFAGFSGCRN